jgi:hypothetical protein
MGIGDGVWTEAEMAAFTWSCMCTICSFAGDPSLGISFTPRRSDTASNFRTILATYRRMGWVSSIWWRPHEPWMLEVPPGGTHPMFVTRPMLSMTQLVFLLGRMPHRGRPMMNWWTPVLNPRFHLEMGGCLVAFTPVPCAIVVWLWQCERAW